MVILRMIREAIPMNIQILKSRKLLLFLSIVATLFLGYQGVKIYSYFSLKNPLDEIYYSETSAFNFLHLPDFSEMIQSSTSYRSENEITSLNLKPKNLKDNESQKLEISNKGSMFLGYRKQLSDNSFLFIDYKYEEGVLTEYLSIAYSDISDEYVNYRKNVSKQNGRNTDIATIYQFNSNVHNNQPSLTNPTEVLEYLKPYNIDKAWLEQKSHKILYDDFLKIWFKKGSQRYSKSNLGNLKIEKAEIFR